MSGKVIGRPLSKQNYISATEEQAISVQHLKSLSQQERNNDLRSYYFVPVYYWQPNELTNHKSYSVSFERSSYATDSKSKLSKRSTEIQPINHHDKEAFDLASEIVSNYFTMRQAGVGLSNPIVDEYYNYGKR